MAQQINKTHIQIYDTSLRDGMQGMQINYTLEDKLQIAQILDKNRIDYIEGGFPLANEKEAEFFKQVKKLQLKHSKIVAFGSTKKPKVKVESDIHLRALLEAETEAVTIVAKSSAAHVTEILGTDLDENLRMAFDSVKYLKSQGREVILDLEHFFDGFTLDAEYAKKVLQAGSDAGADCIVLCDTNGGTLPHEVRMIMQNLTTLSLSPLGVHFHNDCEVAVANSLVGIEMGGIQIQGTMNGWGERAGNANLISIIPNIIIKDNRFDAHCASEIGHLASLSRFMADMANIITDPRQPFVGHAAFSHKAGQHADVILKNSNLMEHMSPESVGNERHVLLSELAGKSTIVAKLASYGDFKKQDIEVENLISLLKKKESEGFEYESAEASFEIEILKELNIYTSLFDLKNYHIEMYKTGDHSSQTVCRIFLYQQHTEVMGSAVGNGPVETIDLSIRNAVKDVFPEIEKIKLIDYKVRVLNPESSASAKVRVLITSSNKESSWTTIGVHENIVEASWQALLDAYDYYYNVIHLQPVQTNNST